MVKKMDLRRNALTAAVLCFVVLKCKAEQLPCKVSHDGPLYSHNIRDHLQQLEKCEYSWSNSSDYALATDVNRTGGSVVSSSHNHLNSSECLGNISVSSTCWNKNGRMVGFSANCIVDCKPEAAPQEGKDNPQVMKIVLVSSAVIIAIIIISVVYLCSRKGKACLRGNSFCNKMYSLVSGSDDPRQQDLEANAK